MKFLASKNRENLCLRAHLVNAQGRLRRPEAPERGRDCDVNANLYPAERQSGSGKPDGQCEKTFEFGRIMSLAGVIPLVHAHFLTSSSLFPCRTMSIMQEPSKLRVVGLAGPATLRSTPYIVRS
jgi:hypothetical protein